MQELIEEVKKTLEWLIEMDLKIYGKIQDGTLKAVEVQGYKFIDGQLQAFY